MESRQRLHVVNSLKCSARVYEPHPVTDTSVSQLTGKSHYLGFSEGKVSVLGQLQVAENQ